MSIVSTESLLVVCKRLGGNQNLKSRGITAHRAQSIQ